jgi:crotonobetainyl-CoA:carnitine CoA-transferase CaiB-like acyl-CoA transferase
MNQADRFWEGFCTVIGRTDLIGDPRFRDLALRAENSRALVEILDGVFGSRTLDEIANALSEQDGQWEIVRQAGDAVVDPHNEENGFFEHVEFGNGTVMPFVRTPAQFDTKRSAVWRSPEVGEHTDEILEELGYSWETVVEMKVAGLIN